MEYYGTLGPSCWKEEVLVPMFEAGMTGIRLNLSHKTLKESQLWIEEFHRAAQAAQVEQARLLIDLIGPEIRIGDLKEDLLLDQGDIAVVYDGDEEAGLCKRETNAIRIPQNVFERLEMGMELCMDDGSIVMEVCAIHEELRQIQGQMPGRYIECIVRQGGVLKSRKSLAVAGLRVQNPTLTKQDLENLACASRYGVTDVMLPFVRNKEDLLCLREVLDQLQCQQIRILAKIENLEGASHLKELLPACDMVVIARGDLGNAVPLTHLPALQREISQTCVQTNKPFMVVTQMLNSMMDHPVPTRAEVNDIFHAVLDGASSVMLTGETAAGQYPVEAMRYLVGTAEDARNYLAVSAMVQ